MSFCPKCGHEVTEEDSLFCVRCGTELPGSEEQSAAGEAAAGPPEGEPAAGGEDAPQQPTEPMPASAAPTEPIPSPDEQPTEAMPFLEEPTMQMPAPVAPVDAGAAVEQPPDGKGKRRKILTYAAVGLIAAAAIAGGVLAYLELADGSGDSARVETVTQEKTVKVKAEPAPLEEPFTLTVDLLDGAIPDELLEMEFLLAEIEIEVDDGDVYGLAQMPAASGDGTVLDAETTLEIKGTYRKGTLKGTWNYYRPFGIADVNANGEIESGGEMTDADAACLLTGTFQTVTDAGADDPRTLDIVTIHFKVED